MNKHTKGMGGHTGKHLISGKTFSNWEQKKCSVSDNHCSVLFGTSSLSVWPWTHLGLFLLMYTLPHSEHRHFHGIYTLRKQVSPECSCPLSLILKDPTAYPPSTADCLIDISKECCQTTTSTLPSAKPTSFSVCFSMTTNLVMFLTSLQPHVNSCLLYLQYMS